MNSVRTSSAVTLSVWKALFLREAVSRISQRRFAWIWLLFEPVVHMVILTFIMTVIRMRRVDGMDTAVWIMVGLMAFFMFKRAAVQAMNAVSSNKALFNYRQVRPVDTVLARAALEGFLTVLIACVLFTGAGLFGFAVIPDRPLAVFSAFLGMWLLGLGFGLTTSVAVEMVPEIGNILQMTMTPLYFTSGVIFPVSRVPYPYREWLLLNPLTHGVEAGRQGFESFYHALAPGELSVAYLYQFALVLIFFGLALHRRFAAKLITQ